MFDVFFQSLWLVLQWPALGYLLVGVAAGLFVGIMPGLSGLTGLAMLLPFTYTVEPAAAFALLLGMFAVTTSSDCIAAILLAMGTTASQATVLDGHQMALQGRAARALGAAFTCSMIGGVIGAVFLALSIPIVRPLILSFASPEFFLLGVLGLTMVGVLSGNSIAKGLVAAMLGLMLSLVGYAKIEGIPRFDFGTTYLLDGIPLVPLALGFFALPELLDLVRGQSISQVPKDRVAGGVMEGVRDTFRHWWVVLRSSWIGIYVGLLPGLGGTIVDWAAYGHVVQSSRDKSMFGKGDVRGVLAPETANNSVRGSALIPVIAFGIPGSAPMAILMGALLIQGLTPGPQMLTTHLNITFSLVWTLVLSNIIAGLVLLAFANRLADLTFVRGQLMFPAVTLFVLMGAWVENNHIADWLCLIGFGALGYLMRLSGFPRPPLILGFVLGPIMENSYFLTNQAYGPVAWLWRPLCVVILVLVVATVASAVIARLRRGQSAGPSTTESDTENPLLSAGLVLATLAICVYAILAARTWPYGAALFPLAIAVPAIVLALLALAGDLRAIAMAAKTRASALAGIRTLLPSATELGPAARFFLLLLALTAATMLAGQRITLPVFVFLNLVLAAGQRWPFALVYAGLSAAFLELMFTHIGKVTWYPSLLFG